jgi:hypothetical protein
MTRLYTFAAWALGMALIVLGIRRGAKKEVKLDAAIAGVEIREGIADATQKHSGDSDDAIRQRLRKRSADAP